ncbi:MAG: AbrB/MazE/SpoVT family DNA-binding domain-containing protein [Bacilli bacterium]
MAKKKIKLKRKVVQIGNSQGVRIPKEVLKLLKVDNDGYIEIEIEMN